MTVNKTHSRFKKVALCALAVSSLLATSYAKEVNVYSTRQPELIKPVLDAFTNKTGVKVNIIFAKDGLLERLQQEGRNSPADVFLSTDVSSLVNFVEAGVTQTIESETLNKNIPAQYRDSKQQWIGLAKRARILIASKDRVAKDSIQTYEDLADPKWKGKICSRGGKSNYNLALISSIIIEKGEDYAKQWLTGVKNNLAMKPQGGDRDQIRAVVAGQCDIAISNSYYFAGLLADSAEKNMDSVYPIFPNQKDRGTHVNISGAIITKYAPNKGNAIKLLEFLSDSEAQSLYAKEGKEYPLKNGIPVDKYLEPWGTFKSDTLALDKIAAVRKRAGELVDIVGFDQ